MNSVDADPYDECVCGDYRHQHHDLGCTICMHGTPPPEGADGCRRFRLGFRVGERATYTANKAIPRRYLS